MYLPGPGTIYLKQQTKFLKPVYIGDTVKAEVKIDAIDEKGRCELKTVVRNQNNDVLVDGMATVILPKEHECVVQ